MNQQKRDCSSSPIQFAYSRAKNGSARLTFCCLNRGPFVTIERKKYRQRGKIQMSNGYILFSQRQRQKQIDSVQNSKRGKK